MIKKTRGTNAGGTALKILIIEDEQLLADSIAEVLRRKGFEAEAVYDGETGAEYAELGVYDLLILDVMMPGLDGYTVARQVRARHLGTPILMLTARSGLEDRITGLNTRFRIMTGKVSMINQEQTCDEHLEILDAALADNWDSAADSLQHHLELARDKAESVIKVIRLW